MISLNPNLTRNARGTFAVHYDGLTQGVAWPAPNAVFNLAGGWLSTAETLPMWGGVGISENVPTQPNAPAPPTGPAVELGGAIGRAVRYQAAGPANGDLTGFSVFDQNYSMINSPESEVPMADKGMQVNFYRLGSGARIIVAMDPALVSLQDDIITGPVAWDFTNQRLIAGTGLNVRVLRVQAANCMTVTYDAPTRTAAWNRNGAAAVILI